MPPSDRTPAGYTRADFGHSPFLVFYEVTRACDLACRHCRASAQPRRNPRELDTGQSKRIIGQLAEFPKRPLLVFTGGDPLKRPDIFELIEHGVRVGLKVAVTPSATPLLTAGAVRRLRAAGVERLALSLDGAEARTHDGIRAVPGSFDRTMEIMGAARAIGLPLQVNTTISTRNLEQTDAIAERLAREGIVLWSVFLLIPVGRGKVEQRIAPAQYEWLFGRLWEHAQRQPYGVKTTEAHHYRRFVLQRRGDPQKDGVGGALRGPRRAPLGINDGNGVMFVSHIGQIYPSGFLPLSCGRFPQDSIVEVYQRAPLFRQLRDPACLKGKCGACEYRTICGGSRARAFAVSGDPLAEEPDCLHVPAAWRREAREDKCSA